MYNYEYQPVSVGFTKKEEVAVIKKILLLIFTLSFLLLFLYLTESKSVSDFKREKENYYRLDIHELREELINQGYSSGFVGCNEISCGFYVIFKDKNNSFAGRLGSVLGVNFTPWDKGKICAYIEASPDGVVKEIIVH